MVWLVVLLALLIPLIAVVLDSQLGRALAGRLEQKTGPHEQSQLATRVNALESEVERLSAQLEHTREETEFVRKLLDAKPESGALPPGGAES